MRNQQDVILYIINYIQELDQSNNFGKVKLNKILWFAHRFYMKEYGGYLSDAEFIRLPYGAVPKKIDATLKKLQSDGKIIIQNINTPFCDETRFFVIVKPSVEFNQNELICIHKAIDFILPLTAKQASQATHDELWDALKNGETMPIESVFLENESMVNDDDLAWAKGVLVKKGIA